MSTPTGPPNPPGPPGGSPDREPTREELLAVVRQVFVERDPVPDGLVARMQAAATLAAGPGLDVELMDLVEQSTELAGTRSTALAGSGETAYTLRFVHGEVDLLLRVALDGDGRRIDGWVVPPEPVTIRVLALDGDTTRTVAAVLSDTGRFELTGLAPGPTRLRLEPHDVLRPPFLTPDFDL